MERFLAEKQVDAKQLSPLTLAFIGDTVYDLLVREEIICYANRSANDLHSLAVKQVRASAQAKAIEDILGHLTEDEITVYKRGRNAHTTTVPKSASAGQYRRATGMEALFAYLYLEKRQDRMNELYEAAFGDVSTEISEPV